MCGILACYGAGALLQRQQVLRATRLIRHRGPDWSGLYSSEKAVLAHELLNVEGRRDREQPVSSNDGSIIVVADTELYNHYILSQELGGGTHCAQSDCEILIELYKKHGTAMTSRLNGAFSFVLYDVKNDVFMVARDTIGVTTLYYGISSGITYFASEMKALQSICEDVQSFQPGTMYCSTDSSFHAYSQPQKSIAAAQVTSLLTQCVVERMIANTSWGLTLSGSLESSIVASITVGEYRKMCPEQELRSFSIGLEGPSQHVPQQVAKYLGLKHTSFTYTIQEGLDALVDAIYQLESYEASVVRDGIVAFMLARKIKSTGLKLVISGLGGSEVFGQRLGSSDNDFHCLRTYKAMMAYGLQCRLPFMDTKMLDLAANTSPSSHALSKAFGGYSRGYGRPYLPNQIAWQPEACLEADANDLWTAALVAEAKKLVPEPTFANRYEIWPVSTPESIEECWYRMIYDNLFPSPNNKPSLITAFANAYDASTLESNTPHIDAAGRREQSVC